MNVFIYSLTDPRNDEIRYVGKACNVQKRYRDHLWEEKRTDRKTNWIKSLKRLGLVPKLDVLESLYECTEESWQKAERFWISYLRFLGCRLTNMEVGGRGGGPPSPESIAKRVAKTTGQKRSEEARQKMRLAKLGRKQSPEHIAARMRNASGRKNAPISEETRRRMRLSHLGQSRPMTEEHKRRIGESNRGRKPSALAIQRSREARATMSISDETRKKLSEATKRAHTEGRIRKPLDGIENPKHEPKRKRRVLLPFGIENRDPQNLLTR